MGVATSSENDLRLYLEVATRNTPCLMWVTDSNMAPTTVLLWDPFAVGMPEILTIGP